MRSQCYCYNLNTYYYKYTKEKLSTRVFLITYSGIIINYHNLYRDKNDFDVYEIVNY